MLCTFSRLYDDFGCPKFCIITFIVKLPKERIPGFSLCNGDKTHEAWKPLLNTLHVFRGLAECLHNESWNLSFGQFTDTNLNAEFWATEVMWKRMCLGTFSRRARSLATTYIFARVRIIGTLVPFYVIGNSKEFPIT